MLAICKFTTAINAKSFSDLSKDKINSVLSNVTYCTINNTSDLFNIVAKSIYNDLPPSTLVDITNCYYDETTLIQTITCDLINVSVVVKRKILPNDSYTYLEYNENNDPYQYLDVTYDDLYNLIYRQHVYQGVYSESSKETNVDILVNKTDDVFGQADIRLNDNIMSLRYMNLGAWISEKKPKDLEFDNEECQELLNDFINDHRVSHFYSRYDMDVGILHLITKQYCFAKNEKVSELIKDDIFGDVFLWLEEKFDNDASSVLRLNTELFNKLVKGMALANAKNKKFYNIYYESS